MDTNVEETRNQILELLEMTYKETRRFLNNADMEAIVYDKPPIWCVRDIIGHLGVWNGEAAKSLSAHAQGREYHCVPSEASYNVYNAAAAEVRRSWSVKQIISEYESSFAQMKGMVTSMPVEKWQSEILYPWNNRGSVSMLIQIMMRHEVEHRQDILNAIA